MAPAHGRAHVARSRADESQRRHRRARGACERTVISAKKIPSPVKPPCPVPKIEQPLGNLARRNVRPGRFVKHPWDGLAEIELMRDLCRRDFWTFFLYAFGYGINPLGNRWIEPEIHEPLARWFQKHVEEWESWRKAGSRKQKKLAVIMHRKGGKTTLIKIGRAS